MTVIAFIYLILEYYPDSDTQHESNLYKLKCIEYMIPISLHLLTVLQSFCTIYTAIGMAKGSSIFKSGGGPENSSEFEGSGSCIFKVL